MQPNSKKKNFSLRFVVDGRASAGRKEMAYGRSPVTADVFDLSGLEMSCLYQNSIRRLVDSSMSIAPPSPEGRNDQFVSVDKQNASTTEGTVVVGLLAPMNAKVDAREKSTQLHPIGMGRRFGTVYIFVLSNNTFFVAAVLVGIIQAVFFGNRSAAPCETYVPQSPWVHPSIDRRDVLTLLMRENAAPSPRHTNMLDCFIISLGSNFSVFLV